MSAFLVAEIGGGLGVVAVVGVGGGWFLLDCCCSGGRRCRSGPNKE